MEDICVAPENSQFTFGTQKLKPFQSPPPPPPNPSSSNFRFPKLAPVLEMYKCDTESVASSSVASKQRIDMLFGDTKSVTSEGMLNKRVCSTGKGYEPRKSKSLVEGEINNTEYSQNEKNDVQVRIEKMFSEISSSEPEPDSVRAAGGSKFVIKHLGCMPVPRKISSLDGLQEPLRELYFKHKLHKKKESTGAIEINDNGLYIEYNSNYGGKVEKLNPFSTIAVWASLRFVLRRITDTAENGYEYAFLPVVSNSETDKNALFRKLNPQHKAHFTDRDFEEDTSLFVVVMREPGTPTKQFVCHGFICDCSEDAVIIAATLYKVLMSKLGKNRIIKNRRKSSSTQLSSIREVSSSEVIPSDTQKSSAPPPKRPPRTKRSVPRNESKESRSRNYESSSEVGDILTKVAIPRSSSFLNTNRLSSRYRSSKNLSLPVHKSSLSPLGFMEMFNELQSQEGLKTVDEILNVIIKAEGMSFNELKPIYKEFLMKLALVLSKDELYNRSKTIMKRQKVTQKKAPPLKKVITTKKGLKNVFRKPLVKLKPKNTTCSCKKSSSKVYNDSTSTDSFFLKEKSKPEMPKLRPTKTTNVRHKTFKFRSHRIISTSEDSDYPNVVNRKYSKNKVKDDVLRPSSSGYFSFSECSYDTESCTCTSADKCYCSLNKSLHAKKTNKPSSQTDFSTYSCDTLACHKWNKCYCAKSKKPSLVEQLKQKGFAVSESSLSPDDSQTRRNSSVKDKQYSKLSKSLEYLENSNSSQFKNRMELYDLSGQKAYPCKHTYKYCPSMSSQDSRGSHKKSTSSDNLAVDYSLFAKLDSNQGTKVKDPISSSSSSVFKGTRRLSTTSKQNVVYAELACPQMLHGPTFNRNYSMSQILKNVEPPPQIINMYPRSPMRSCNCPCTCPLYAGDMYPTSCCETNIPYKNSTYFRRMNMENILGYYP